MKAKNFKKFRTKSPTIKLPARKSRSFTASSTLETKMLGTERRGRSFDEIVVASHQVLMKSGACIGFGFPYSIFTENPPYDRFIFYSYISMSILSSIFMSHDRREKICGF